REQVLPAAAEEVAALAQQQDKGGGRTGRRCGCRGQWRWCRPKALVVDAAVQHKWPGTAPAALFEVRIKRFHSVIQTVLRPIDREPTTDLIATLGISVHSEARMPRAHV